MKGNVGVRRRAECRGVVVSFGLGWGNGTYGGLFCRTFGGTFLWVATERTKEKKKRNKNETNKLILVYMESSTRRRQTTGWYKLLRRTVGDLEGRFVGCCDGTGVGGRVGARVGVGGRVGERVVGTRGKLACCFVSTTTTIAARLFEDTNRRLHHPT